MAESIADVVVSLEMDIQDVQKQFNNVAGSIGQLTNHFARLSEAMKLPVSSTSSRMR